jgi:hypothetical protein
MAILPIHEQARAIIDVEPVARAEVRVPIDLMPYVGAIKAKVQASRTTAEMLQNADHALETIANVVAEGIWKGTSSQWLRDGYRLHRDSTNNLIQLIDFTMTRNGDWHATPFMRVDCTGAVSEGGKLTLRCKARFDSE